MTENKLFKYQGWRLYSSSQFTALLISHSLTHTHSHSHTHTHTHTHTTREAFNALLWFQDIASGTRDSWGRTQSMISECDPGQRQKGRSDFSLWRNFREIFGDTIFGKWLRWSSVAGGWQSKPLQGSWLWCCESFLWTALCFLSLIATSCLSWCGIVSV